MEKRKDVGYAVRDHKNIDPFEAPNKLKWKDGRGGIIPYPMYIHGKHKRSWASMQRDFKIPKKMGRAGLVPAKPRFEIVCRWDEFEAWYNGTEPVPPPVKLEKEKDCVDCGKESEPVKVMVPKMSDPIGEIRAAAKEATGMSDEELKTFSGNDGKKELIRLIKEKNEA